VFRWAKKNDEGGILLLFLRAFSLDDQIAVADGSRPWHLEAQQRHAVSKVKPSLPGHFEIC
jgi:hypothetical protein